MATLLGGQTCVDPRDLEKWCAALGLPTERWKGRANAFTLEPGRAPGRGWILLRKSDLDLLDFTTAQTLTFSGTDATHVLTLQSITLLQRECVLPGSSTDPNSVYLCEVVDRRHHLARVPLPNGCAAYNVRAADDSAYLTGTLNSGVAWTWQGIVNDLVTTLGESTSAFVLPFTPDGTPQNLVFDGVSAWEALNRVLDRLACVPVYDPTTDTFSVVRLGVEQDAPLTAIDAERTWDGYSSEEVRGWRPEKVRVRFLRRPQPSDGASPYYTVDITLTATTGVVSGTYVQLDDDATAEAATGTPTNSTALATRAQERADDWLRKRQYYERPVLRVWYDFLPDGPGLAGHAVYKVVFDDRGLLQTAARAEPDGRLEAFRPLGSWPPWWPRAVSSWKKPVKAATVAALPTNTYANGTLGDGATLTGNANGALAAQDGVTLAAGDAILVKNEATAANNGIYTLTQVGDASNPYILTRRSDADSPSDLLAAAVAVEEGTTNADTVWLGTANATIIVGTTSLPWILVGPSASSISSWKQPARAATTRGGTLATDFANGSVIDGVTLVTGDRILIKDQVTASENGIYVVNASGAPTRGDDADTGSELLGAVIVIEEGTTNADTMWLGTANATIIVGTTSLPWVQIGGGGITGTGTDNHIVRWNGPTAIQDSFGVIDDSGNMSGIGDLGGSGNCTFASGTVTGASGVFGQYDGGSAFTETVTLGNTAWSNGGTGPGAQFNYLSGTGTPTDGGRMCWLQDNTGFLFGTNLTTLGAPNDIGLFVQGHFGIKSRSFPYGYTSGVSGSLADGSSVAGGIVTSIGTPGASGTIDLTTATSITVTNGLITGWS